MTSPDPPNTGLANFFSSPYQEHNRARLDHLQSLGLPLSNRRVLELGSGPGDHTGFYVERQCEIVSVDSRQDCLDVLRERYPGVRTVLCDLNAPAPLAPLGQFEVIHCYGLLYHLENPGQLLAYMGEASSGLAILETCVSADRARTVDTVEEATHDYTNSSTGKGCRPARQWIFEELGRLFPFVYQTRTQPNHPEFPVDWNDLANTPPLIRSVFVASRQPLDLPSLSPTLLDIQERLDPRTYTAALESTLAEYRTIAKEREELIERLHADAAEREALIQRLHGEAENLLGQLKRAVAAVEELDTRRQALEATIEASRGAPP